MTRERRERDGKTHRPIVPAGNPRADHLSVGATSEKLLAGWLAGGKEVPSVRRTPYQSGVRERYEKDELGWVRVSGWVDREANDTSLGNFNFAEITVEANKNKEISAKFSPSLCVSSSLSFFSLFYSSSSSYSLLFSLGWIGDTSLDTTDIIRSCRPMYRTMYLFDFLSPDFAFLLSFFLVIFLLISF